MLPQTGEHEDRSKLCAHIVSLGGTISPLLHKRVSYLIATPASVRRKTQRVRNGAPQAGVQGGMVFDPVGGLARLPIGNHYTDKFPVGNHCLNSAWTPLTLGPCGPQVRKAMKFAVPVVDAGCAAKESTSVPHTPLHTHTMQPAMR